MAHTISKVVPKITYCNFTTVQSTADKCNTTNIFKAKLRSTNNKMFLRTWSLQVRVPDISSTNWEAKEGGVREGNADALLRYDPSKAKSRRARGLVPIFNPMRLSREIHFNIKHNVAGGFVPTRRSTLIRS